MKKIHKYNLSSMTLDIISDEINKLTKRLNEIRIKSELYVDENIETLSSDPDVFFICIDAGFKITIGTAFWLYNNDTLVKWYKSYNQDIDKLTSFIWKYHKNKNMIYTERSISKVFNIATKDDIKYMTKMFLSNGMSKKYIANILMTSFSS